MQLTDSNPIKVLAERQPRKQWCHRIERNRFLLFLLSGLLCLHTNTNYTNCIYKWHIQIIYRLYDVQIRCRWYTHHMNISPVPSQPSHLVFMSSQTLRRGERFTVWRQWTLVKNRMVVIWILWVHVIYRWKYIYIYICTHTHILKNVCKYVPVIAGWLATCRNKLEMHSTDVWNERMIVIMVYHDGKMFSVCLVWKTERLRALRACGNQLRVERILVDKATRWPW